jgi:hypothetical protein
MKNRKKIMNYREAFLKTVDEKIRKYGYQITDVKGGQNPSFAYTIGLYEKFGFELVIAGAYISKEFNEKIFRTVISGLESGLDVDSVFKAEHRNEDDLKLIEMHSTWKELMILGAFIHYNNDEIRAFQILAVDNILLDTPIMSNVRDSEDPIWCWLDKNWNEDIPLSSYVSTDVDFLKGKTIVEVMRFEDGFWEMFTRPAPDVPDEDVRILPISTMIAIDESLKPSLKLSNGDGLLRKNKDSKWKSWE